jgi:hypothetical protein
MNGLLEVNLVREVPEQLKPRKVEINSRSQTPSQPAQIEQDNNRQAKAA